MADDLNEAEGEEPAEEPKKKMGKSKLIGIILGGVLGLVLIGGGAATYFGAFDELLGIEREKKSATLALGEPVTHELPQIRADLKTGLCRSPFLRATVVVQLNDTDLKKLQANEVKVMDAITAHLREQERQDLVGKAGAEKLRFDMVNVINAQLTPVRVHTVLFKEFVLQ